MHGTGRCQTVQGVNLDTVARPRHPPWDAVEAEGWAPVLGTIKHLNTFSRKFCPETLAETGQSNREMYPYPILCPAAAPKLTVGYGRPLINPPYVLSRGYPEPEKLRVSRCLTVPGGQVNGTCQRFPPDTRASPSSTYVLLVDTNRSRLCSYNCWNTIFSLTIKVVLHKMDLFLRFICKSAGIEPGSSNRETHPVIES